MSTDLRFRQIHLDFHTSEKIAGIGEAFDPDHYADTLAKAGVDSVTTFARCHHGYLYYHSQQNPERHHPHLTRNLLKEQIDACHQRDIRVPIYVTVQWDQFTADEHPEWVELMEDGKYKRTPPFEPGFYKFLLTNTPYYDFLEAHVAELLEMFEVDGFFFDIVQPYNDCSIWTKRQMLDAGLDPANERQRKQFGVETINEFKKKLTKFIRTKNDDCTIFYNAGHIGPRLRPVKNAYTHWELESLPSGGWGYMHFPSTIRYARTLGHDCMGMTGKFHTSWGDFHSFKNQPALEFECFQMLAHNAKCSIGDQLHPTGEICETTYDLIGSVYNVVKEKQPWCEGAKAITEIGVITPEAFEVGGTGHTGMTPQIMGAVRVLQEAGYQFDILDTEGRFSDYRLLVLPDSIPIDKALAKKLSQFVKSGGAILATGKSGLDPDGEAFALKDLGVTLKGDAPYHPDFLKPRPGFRGGLANTEYVMYNHGQQVKANKGAKVLADCITPYFNRAWDHFCSHRHTPSNRKKGYPAVVQNGNCIYMAHPVFATYHEWAPKWIKQAVVNAVEKLLPERLLTHDGPSFVIATLNEQKAKKRQIVHLLGYIPERRGTKFDVIEDVVPVYDITVTVKSSRKPKGVTCAPEGCELDFEYADGRLTFTLPKLDGHQMIELKF